MENEPGYRTQAQTPEDEDEVRFLVDAEDLDSPVHEELGMEQVEEDYKEVASIYEGAVLGNKTTVKVKEAEPSEEEWDLIEDVVPQELRLIPEFKEILKENIDDVVIVSKLPTLYKYPDVQLLFEEILDKIERIFTKDTVLQELHRMYQTLVLARANEAKLNNSLTVKEEEVLKARNFSRRDPRVSRTLNLAFRWRQERDSTAVVNHEQSILIASLTADVRDLENRVSTLLQANSRLLRDKEKIPHFEDHIRGLEEKLLIKENQLSDQKEVVDNFKVKVNEELFRADEQCKAMVAKARAHPSVCEQELQVEKDLAVRRENFLDETHKRMTDLEHELANAKKSELLATQKFRNISNSLKSMKIRLKKLESAMNDSNRKNETLMNRHTLDLKKITDLEQQVRQKEDDQQILKHLLKASNHNNETLKSQLSTLAITEKKFAKYAESLKIIKKKEEEMLAANMYAHSLEDELKLAERQLTESTRQRETQAIVMNRAREKEDDDLRSLKLAIQCNDRMFQRLEWTEAHLRLYQKKFDACTNNNLEMLSMIHHLDTLCSKHQNTIRIQNSKNESLELNVSNLEETLNEAKIKMEDLRKTNLVTLSNYMRQTEIYNMLETLLKFSEAEKMNAVHQSDRCANNVAMLQKNLVQKLDTIASQHKDNCSLKVTIQRHLSSLDIQKKEAHKLKELLAAALTKETALYYKLKKLVHDRDIFAATVIKKNTHVQLLKSQNSLLRTILSRGKSGYQDRVNDIRLLKLEIKRLRHQVANRNEKLLVSTDLRQEMVRLTQLCRLEMNKRRAIEDLKVPRVHRFVNMKCSDPGQYEKLLKIHKLQRILITKSVEVTKLETSIRHKNIQMHQLLVLLVRTADSRTDGSHEVRTVILQKNKHIKCLLSEINLLTHDLRTSEVKLERAFEEVRKVKEENAKLKRQSKRLLPDVTQTPFALSKKSIKEVNFGFGICQKTLTLELPRKQIPVLKPILRETNSSSQEQQARGPETTAQGCQLQGVPISSQLDEPHQLARSNVLLPDLQRPTTQDQGPKKVLLVKPETSSTGPKPRAVKTRPMTPWPGRPAKRKDDVKISGGKDD